MHNVSFASSLLLDANTEYWVSISAHYNNFAGDGYFWTSAAVTVDDRISSRYFDGYGWYENAAEPFYDFGGVGDLAFEIHGSPVPVPAAVWLFGSGLLGLLGLGSRKRKQLV